MALLWYSSSPKNLILSTWVCSSFYSVFLGLQGTSNFSLLPLKAHAVTVAQGLVFSFFFITSFFWCDQAKSPQMTFHLQDPFRLLILAIWSSSLFQLFGCLPFLSFFPNSCWVESSFPAASTYCFSHLWFLVVQLLCS